MKKNQGMTLDDLTKGNIWSVTESELANMLIDGKKAEDYKEMQAHYMNIIRTVFDLQFIDRKDEDLTRRFEQQGYEIFSYPCEEEEEGPDAIAIRKRPIRKIGDLTLENIRHIEAADVLELIRNNMGTGWKGLSLSIQDIIESAFYVDYTALPEATMHRAGGILDRRREDGYEALEIVRGAWIEAIFLKPKPKVEKIKIDYSFRDSDDDDKDLDDESYDDEQEDKDDDDDFADDPEDSTPNRDDDDFGDDDQEDADPEIENIEDIEDIEDPSEEE